MRFSLIVGSLIAVFIHSDHIVCRATVPSIGPTPRALPLSNALRLDPDSCQNVANFLPASDLNTLMQVARFQRQQLNHGTLNPSRGSPWGVFVRTKTKSVWLNAAVDAGWDQAEEILEGNARCLVPGPPHAKSLLNRLPLKSWSEQAQRSAQEGVEPSYHKELSKLLGVQLNALRARAFSARSVSSTSAASTSAAGSSQAMVARKVQATQLLLAMQAYLTVGLEAAVKAVQQATRALPHYVLAQQAEPELTSALNEADRLATLAVQSITGPYTHLLAHNAIWKNAGEPAAEAGKAAADAAVAHLLLPGSTASRPSIDLITKTVYRAAELASQTAMLKHSEVAVQNAFTQTKRFIGVTSISPQVSTPEAWRTYKAEHFAHADPHLRAYWDPWLHQIDQLLE